MEGAIYRRDLPHRFPLGHSIFITWRLEGSLPAPTAVDWVALRNLSPRASMIRIEKLLDAANYGPRWLSDPRVAEIVCTAIEDGETQYNRYKLHAYVVMVNHVHMLVTPRCEMATIMNQLKGVTARRANLVLRRTGSPFWRSESFDRWCRDAEHFYRVVKYIELNPVKAGLATVPGVYPWGSAHRREAKNRAEG